MGSFVNDSSSSVRCSNNGDGIETKYVPKSKRRLGISWEPPSPAELPHLHDAPSTLKYTPDSPPSPPSREVKWYELRHGQRFKNKNQLKLSIGIIRILYDFDTLCKSSSPKFLRIICKDPTEACGRSMYARKMPSLNWWEITRIAAPHSCTGNNMKPLLKKKVMARAMVVLFRKNFSRSDVVDTPRQLCEDMKREHGIIITYKQGLTDCKRGIEAVRGSLDESY
ncbi:hypothetical protein MKW98_002807 [Papaver atlanticum]|uniref:Uncharacterized protein n=1 Tax=Papaver atlanticum TaxID=357466 RepID=A0AAD4S618_9MAGN|nr:hypothetical protein MKW98_002807 [Papaver atlanticum]